jgi:DNA-binding HxlR family transcriptional regulator
MADALALVGDRWTLHVVREVGMGVRRFDAIQRRTGAPREMLASRLRKLESTGVITRTPYCDRPPRFEYALTTVGEELIPVMAALFSWGERHATPRLTGERAPAPGTGCRAGALDECDGEGSGPDL